MLTAAAISGTVSGTGTVKASRASAGSRAGSSPVLVWLLSREGSLGTVPVPSMLAAVLVPGTGGTSDGLTDGPWGLRGTPVVGPAPGAGILTSLPFPVLSLVSRVGHLLDEVQGHLGVDMAGRMDRVQGPTCPKGLFHLLPAAAGAADQLDAVQHDSWLQLLLEEKFQLRQVRDECRQEVRVLVVGDVFQAVAAGARHISGHRGDDENVVVLKLIDHSLQLVDRVLHGTFRGNNQGSFHMVAVITLNTF